MLPIVLVPGLNCSARLFANQIPHLWRFGSVTIADHTRGESVEAIASQILASAPSRFLLAGFSLGGYTAFEILRQGRERVARLALLDTGARADTPEQAERRRERIAMVQAGRFNESLDFQFPVVVHPSRRDDATLRSLYHLMATECGADALIRHLNASMGRPDSRPDLAGIRCPTIVVVGKSDQLTPPRTRRGNCGGYYRGTARRRTGFRASFPARTARSCDASFDRPSGGPCDPGLGLYLRSGASLGEADELSANSSPRNH